MTHCAASAFAALEFFQCSAPAACISMCGIQQQRTARCIAYRKPTLLAAVCTGAVQRGYTSIHGAIPRRDARHLCRQVSPLELKSLVVLFPIYELEKVCPLVSRTWVLEVRATVKPWRVRASGAGEGAENGRYRAGRRMGGCGMHCATCSRFRSRVAIDAAPSWDCS